MKTVNEEELKDNLSYYLNLVTEHNATVKVTTNCGNAVMISGDKFKSLTETHK